MSDLYHTPSELSELLAGDIMRDAEQWREQLRKEHTENSLLYTHA